MIYDSSFAPVEGRLKFLPGSFLFIFAFIFSHAIFTLLLILFLFLFLWCKRTHYLRQWSSFKGFRSLLGKLCFFVCFHSRIFQVYFYCRFFQGSILLHKAKSMPKKSDIRKQQRSSANFPFVLGLSDIIAQCNLLL